MRCSLMVAGVLAAAAAAADAGASEAPKKLRVLLLTGKNNHNWRRTTPVLVKLYEDSGRFAVTVEEDPATCSAATFARHDVVVSNWTPWPDVKKRIWDEATEKAFLEFVRGGGGVAVFHAASTAFQNWEAFQRIVGATWKLGQTGHGKRHEFAVTPADANHPVTAGLKPFRIVDELWHRMGRTGDPHVLATAKSEKKAGGSGQVEPVAFCTRFGEGRGFNLVLGHDTRAMACPGWQALMLRGTEWAATGEVSAAAGSAEGAFSWAKDASSVALLWEGETVWKFVHTPPAGLKPYIHPLALPGSKPLTWLSPPDHKWHLGLWFCWKHLNGVNYWEPDRKTGKPAGATRVTSVKVAVEDHSARVAMTVSYRPRGSKGEVLAERRLVRVTAPEADGRYRVDWTATFTAGAEDVILKGGTHGGGYAGLSIRLAKLTKDWQVVDSAGRANLEAHGKKARWVAWSGKVPDGGAACLAMFDHPENPRHPSPWYVAVRRRIPFNYFSPALLFHEPLTLPAGESMTLRYRTRVHPGPADVQALEAEWKAFSKTTRTAPPTSPRGAGGDGVGS